MRLFRHDDPQHIEAAELLPWLVNDTLDPDERRRVEAHLAECIACRHELAQLRAWHALYQREDADRAASRGLERVQGRIDEIESSLAAQRLWRRSAARWKGLPTWARITLMTQAALLCIMLVLLLVLPEPHYYHTLGAVPTATSDRALLVAVFNSMRPEREIRALLLGLNARIVDGPSLEGAYTLEVKAGEEQRVLAQLRSRSVVIFAEPGHLPQR